MPPKAKSEGDIISFLIACVEHSEKTDWQAIAVNTGLYKAGKFRYVLHSTADIVLC